MFANSLTGDYGALTAIEIVRELRDRGFDVGMIMNGVGPERKSCEKLIHDLDLRRHIRFTDDNSSWENLHMVYAQCEILILPAKFSNGNASVLEAMASGMGIVISNGIIYTSDFVKDNNGFVVPPSVKEFADAVQCYLEDPELFHRHTQLNRTAVRHRCFAPSARRYAMFFQSVASGAIPK